MILLPANFMMSARVDVEGNRFLLHFKNSANQYFTYYKLLDKAFPLDEQLETIRSEVASTLGDTKAYRLLPNLKTVYEHPVDQEWVAAPIPAEGIYSLEQYAISLGLKIEPTPNEVADAKQLGT